MRRIGAQSQLCVSLSVNIHGQSLMVTMTLGGFWWKVEATELLAVDVNSTEKLSLRLELLDNTVKFAVRQSPLVLSLDHLDRTLSSGKTEI